MNPYTISRKLPGILLLILVLAACQRFFMPVKSTANTPSEKGAYISGNQMDKYFILRQGSSAYAMKQIVVDKEKNTLTCVLETVPPQHRLYLNSRSAKYVYNYEKDDEYGNVNTKVKAPVLREVHIYVKNEVPALLNQQVTIQLDQIDMIEILEHDSSRTTSSYVLGGIGIGVGAIVLAGVIIALTKESCPYVSIYDGNQYQLQGELFGGAVNRQLERTDYVPLSAPLINDQYRIRSSNQLKERQYTNSAALRIVEHPLNVKAFIDGGGNVYTVGQTVAPSEAWLNTTDIRKQLQSPDGKACTLNDTTHKNGLNNLRLVFPVNDETKQAKLILRLKNSYWLDYLYGEFARRFGSNYVKWQQQQQQRPAEDMMHWINEQRIPLQISIHTSTGWQQLASIKTTGPLLNRDIVVPVQLSNVKGNNIEIKLSSGFMFWELDYAALDQSTDQCKVITDLYPLTATDEQGQSVREALLNNDTAYLTQLQAGNAAELVYEWKQQPQQGHAYSVFLVTRGYYEPIREFTGKPDIAFLKQFRKPEALSAFSMNNWKQFVKESNTLANKQNR